MRSEFGTLDALLVSPTTAMKHIAMVEKLDGKRVELMEHVSDEQYQS